MKLKSLVIASYYLAVNMSLFLAHTARQTNRVGQEWGSLIRESQIPGPQEGLSRNKVSVGESADGSPPSFQLIENFNFIFYTKG